MDGSTTVRHVIMGSGADGEFGDGSLMRPS